MSGFVFNVYRYYFSPNYEVNITVILILQMWELRNRIITYVFFPRFQRQFDI